MFIKQKLAGPRGVIAVYDGNGNLLTSASFEPKMKRTLIEERVESVLALVRTAEPSKKGVCFYWSCVEMEYPTEWRFRTLNDYVAASWNHQFTSWYSGRVFREADGMYVAKVDSGAYESKWDRICTDPAIEKCIAQVARRLADQMTEVGEDRLRGAMLQPTKEWRRLPPQVRAQILERHQMREVDDTIPGARPIQGGTQTGKEIDDLRAQIDALARELNKGNAPDVKPGIAP